MIDRSVATRLHVPHHSHRPAAAWGTTAHRARGSREAATATPVAAIPHAGTSGGGEQGRQRQGQGDPHRWLARGEDGGEDGHGEQRGGGGATGSEVTGHQDAAVADPPRPGGGNGEGGDGDERSEGGCGIAAGGGGEGDAEEGGGRHRDGQAGQQGRWAGSGQGRGGEQGQPRRVHLAPRREGQRGARGERCGDDRCSAVFSRHPPGHEHPQAGGAQGHGVEDEGQVAAEHEGQGGGRRDPAQVRLAMAEVELSRLVGVDRGVAVEEPRPEGQHTHGGHGQGCPPRCDRAQRSASHCSSRGHTWCGARLPRTRSMWPQ